jgi:hypothetical protein
MPAQTLEQVRQKQAQLEKAFAGLGEGADRTERRAVHKRLRRAQRKRRKLTAAAERGAKPEPQAAEQAAETPQASTEE